MGAKGKKRWSNRINITYYTLKIACVCLIFACSCSLSHPFSFTILHMYIYSNSLPLPSLTFHVPPPPRASWGSAIHVFLVYSFNMGIPSLPFPNSLFSRVLSLPPFYFSSSGRYYVFLCNEESKNSIEDWLNLTFYRTFTVFHWKRDASKEPFQFILETCYRWIIKYWCFSFVSIGLIYHGFIFITE